MSKRNKTRKTYDPKSRWNVVRIDHNEQDKGGKLGKRYVMNAKPMRREKAETLLVCCEQECLHMKEIWGSKNDYSYSLELAM